MNNTKKLWLYRVLETDDDGDPLDHGAARAEDANELSKFLSGHLCDIVGEGVQMTVRVYLLKDADEGVLGHLDPFLIYSDLTIGTKEKT